VLPPFASKRPFLVHAEALSQGGTLRSRLVPINRHDRLDPCLVRPLVAIDAEALAFRSAETARRRREFRAPILVDVFWVDGTQAPLLDDWTPVAVDLDHVGRALRRGLFGRRRRLLRTRASLELVARLVGRTIDRNGGRQ
jgi:hypothetical protein